MRKEDERGCFHVSLPCRVTLPRNFTDTSPKKKKKKMREKKNDCTNLDFYQLRFARTQTCTTQDLTHPLCHNAHSVCIHQLFVRSFFHFFLLFFFFNELGRGTSTLALYIAWYSEESAKNIRTDLLKCFLCTSLSCSISSPHYDI